jgi:hypothetical protein
MKNRYELINEEALYAKNQNILKRYIPLDTRQTITKLRLIVKDPKPFFIRKLAIIKSLRLQKPKQSISENGVSELCGKKLPHFEKTFSYWLERSNDLINNKKLNNTKYFKPLLNANEILMHKPTLKFAFSHELLSIIGEYLGSAPSFHEVSLWWGKEGELSAGSPFFHLDSLDSSCIRLYMYLSDVGEGNGPFCVIPKKESLRFIRKTGYLGNSLSDKTVFKYLPLSSLRKLTGDAGSIFAIDSTRALHYGSRCIEGDRVVLIFTYSSYHNAANTSSFLEFLPRLNNLTTLQEMAYDHISIK